MRFGKTAQRVDSEGMEFEIDKRMTDILPVVAATNERGWGWDFSRAWGMMRWAYARGHTDAIESPDPEALYRDYGFQVPERED